MFWFICCKHSLLISSLIECILYNNYNKNVALVVKNGNILIYLLEIGYSNNYLIFEKFYLNEKEYIKCLVTYYE